MRIAHECPLSIYDTIQSKTDYDYALVHLLDENESYHEKFINRHARGNTREWILDNSLFELETPFDPVNFAEKIMEYQPDWYVIPDKLEDAAFTVANVHAWDREFDYVPGKRIGVVQGTTVDEVIQCYLEIEPFVEKIAFSFDYSFFVDPEDRDNTKYVQYMLGRATLLKQLDELCVINPDLPHHLLGCGVPQEFKLYGRYKWIDTVDTSNPVVHGMFNIRYSENGLPSKDPRKLHTLIDEEVTPEQLKNILFNVDMFRKFCNG